VGGGEAEDLGVGGAGEQQERDWGQARESHGWMRLYRRGWTVRCGSRCGSMSAMAIQRQFVVMR
jgi:hypothetical protein